MRALEILSGAAGGEALPAMIARATTSGHVVLGVWVDAGARSLLGRYQAMPPGAVGERRHTGGRTVPCGPGHVRLAMALPHRSAIEGEPSTLLRPEQAMNRCVRGLLDACRRLGADPSYPGRDVVTAGGTAIGWLSLTEVVGGAALFEAGLAVEAPLADVALVDLVRGAPVAEDAVRAVVDAYRQRPWASVGDTEATSLPTTDPAELSWPIPADADRAGRVATMLGTLGVHVGLDDSHRLRTVRIVGDVIAPVETVRAVEESLIGVVPLRSEMERAVACVMDDPTRWMLGADPVRDVPAAIAEALR